MKLRNLSAAMLPVAALTGCGDRLPEKPNIVFLLFLFPLRQFFFQIAQRRFALGAGSGAFPLVFALGGHIGNVIFCCNLLANVLQNLAFAFSVHKYAPFVVLSVLFLILL